MSRLYFAIAWLLALTAAPAAAQQQWREYPSIERGWYGRDNHPDEAPGEFVVGRLMFPQIRRGYMLGAGPGDWRPGVDRRLPRGRPYVRALARASDDDRRAARRAARQPR